MTYKIQISLVSILFLTITFSSCKGKSGDSQDTTNDNSIETVEIVEPAKIATEFDIDKLNIVANKTTKEITEADLDFIIDQVEVLVNKTENLNEEELRQFRASMDGQTAVALAMICTSVKKMFSPTQLERYNRITSK